MPEGYPLSPVDANGTELREGALVRIRTIPEWLTHNLPLEDVSRLKAVEGTVMRVLELDAYGYVWFGEHGPWFCLRPDEVQRIELETVSDTAYEIHPRRYPDRQRHFVRDMGYTVGACKGVPTSKIYVLYNIEGTVHGYPVTDELVQRYTGG